MQNQAKKGISRNEEKGNRKTLEKKLDSNRVITFLLSVITTCAPSS